MLARLVEDFGQLHHFDWLRELSGTETERLRRQSVQREYRAGEISGWLVLGWTFHLR